MKKASTRVVIVEASFAKRYVTLQTLKTTLHFMPALGSPTYTPTLNTNFLSPINSLDEMPIRVFYLERQIFNLAALS